MSPPNNKKYRSQVRDQSRIFTPPDNKKQLIIPGSIQYNSHAPRFSAMMREAEEVNRKTLFSHYEKTSVAIVDSLDALHSLAAKHAWALSNWPDAVPHPANPVLFACFHKSLLSLHAAHELTLDGLYGIARPHLRHAFESLMIAKLCATDPDSEVFDKWIDGLDLYFTNGILKRIVYPSNVEFSDFWSLLCQWSHATVFAAQWTLDIETTPYESEINLALIGTLLNFEDHLLNQQILTPTVKYYTNRYNRNRVELLEFRELLKSSLAVIKPILGDCARALVRNYRAKWHLK